MNIPGFTAELALTNPENKYTSQQVVVDETTGTREQIIVPQKMKMQTCICDDQTNVCHCLGSAI